MQSLPQTGLFVGPGLVGALPGFGPEAAILSLFLANQINSVFSIANPAFATYDLQSSIGPIGGLVGINPNQREPANFIPVTFGAVELQSASDVTFTADLLATPEPLPVMLFSVGLIALGLLRKSTFILDRKR